MFKWCSVGTKWYKVWQNIYYTTPPWSFDTIKATMNPYYSSPVLTWASEGYSGNWDSSHQATFFNLLMSNWWARSKLTGVAPGVVCCCCRLQSYTCCAFRDVPLHLVIRVIPAFLSAGSIPSTLFWPLTSARPFRLENCRSLDSFCFWSILCKP